MILFRPLAFKIVTESHALAELYNVGKQKPSWRNEEGVLQGFLSTWAHSLFSLCSWRKPPCPGWHIAWTSNTGTCYLRKFQQSRYHFKRLMSSQSFLPRNKSQNKDSHFLEIKARKRNVCRTSTIHLLVYALMSVSLNKHILDFPYLASIAMVCGWCRLFSVLSHSCFYLLPTNSLGWFPFCPALFLLLAIQPVLLLLPLFFPLPALGASRSCGSIGEMTELLFLSSMPGFTIDLGSNRGEGST